MTFNGVVLQSTILNFGLDDLTGAEESGFPLYLPSEAATAWYHHALPGSWLSLDALVSEVESFALGEYSDALAKGDTIPASEFNDVAAKLHRYTGLPEEYIRLANLRVPYWQFENVLFRNQGKSSGASTRALRRERSIATKPSRTGIQPMRRSTARLPPRSTNICAMTSATKRRCCTRRARGPTFAPPAAGISNITVTNNRT